MEHLIFPPPIQLSPYVKYFWSFEVKEMEGLELLIQAFVNDSNGLTFVMDDSHPLHRATLEGQKTMPYRFDPIHHIRAFGVQFRTGMMPLLFRENASEFTNKDIALDDVIRDRISDQVLNAGSFEERIAIVSDFLVSLTRLRSGNGKPGLDYIRYVASQNGQVTVRDMTQYFKISERQLERKFQEVLGVSPRHYLKVVRFQQVLSMLKQQRTTSLTEIAYRAGFFDQAHFINVVKRLSGLSPGKLQSQLHKLAVNQRGSTRYLIDVIKPSDVLNHHDRKVIYNDLLFSK